MDRISSSMSTSRSIIDNAASNVPSWTSVESVDYTLRACKKYIRTEEDLRMWLNSKSHSQFMEFIVKVAETCKGKRSMSSLRDLGDHETIRKLFVEADPSEVENQIRILSEKDLNQSGLIKELNSFSSALTDLGNKSAWSLIAVLRKMLQWVDEIPPIQQPTRFGNQAFKTWFKRLIDEATGMLSTIWEVSDTELRDQEIKEMEDYFCSSFGSPVRLDFGSGHEVSFAMFLSCLFKKKILSEEHHMAFAALCIFKGYLDLTHTLQKVYMLEAAGSRGVWGLDDFHFLPFLWGAAQLSGQYIVEPSQICDVQLVNSAARGFLYFDSIKYILDTKRGAPFSECAPILYDVSGLPSWGKIYSGLVKMYAGEVLPKLPIVQHFLFGSMIVFP